MPQRLVKLLRSILFTPPYIRLESERSSISQFNSMRFNSSSSSPRPTKTSQSEQSYKSSGENSSKSINPSYKGHHQSIMERDTDHLAKMREAMGGVDMAN